MPEGYPKFKEFLDQNGISQTEVGELLGFSRTKVNLISFLLDEKKTLGCIDG